jgi:hypothetical protein
MICIICKTRFAEYPAEDFIFKKDGIAGIYAKNEAGHKKREKIFLNDEKGFCSEECENCFLFEI